MAVTTYSELLTAIQDYQADTSTVITGRQEDWVLFAEQRMAYGFGEKGMPFYSPPLRVRAMEASIVIPITAALAGGTSTVAANEHSVPLSAVPTLSRGVCMTFTAGETTTGETTINAGGSGSKIVKKGSSLSDIDDGDIVAGASVHVYYDGTYWVLMPSAGSAPLPTRYLGLRSLYFQGDYKNPLNFMSSAQFNGMESLRDTGRPTAYTIEGDTMRFAPVTGGSYYLSFNYYRKPAALSSSLNDIFRNAPTIYLYGALLESSLYLQDNENAGKWHAQFMSACQGLVSADQRDRYGSAPLQMRAEFTP